MNSICAMRLLFSRLPMITISRNANTVPDYVIEKHRNSKLSNWKEPITTETSPMDTSLERSRELYPEFLPDVIWYRRDKIKEKLERADMLKRRSVIQIPEFYVGSVLKVTSSNQNAVSRETVFVGICIKREGFGLQHSFTLRNVVEGMGVEIMFHMYNPTIRKIEVLKLEKSLDQDLQYLKDAPPEYSTFPMDMEPVVLPKGSAIPINTQKVPLNNPPWFRRWELLGLKNAVIPPLREPREKRAQIFQEKRDYEKWDLMKKYRSHTRDEDATEILTEVRAADRKHKTLHKMKSNETKSSDNSSDQGSK